jgi:predicted metalloprotease with PDZ domain
MVSLISAVTLNPGRTVRSAEEMSRMAPFIDGGNPVDRTNWTNTVISYYPFGGAIALALDLTLRERSAGRVTLDDFMRAMWRDFGRPGGRRPGYVDRPYTRQDAEATLATVSGDAGFARDFFARYITGHEVADYARLLLPAGLLLRKQNPGRAWWGDVALELRSGGVRVAVAPLANTPAYAAGLDVDDELRQVDGTKISAVEDVASAIRRRRPGDAVSVSYVDRSGTARTAALTLAEDPHLELVPVEAAGGVLTPERQTFRSAWLGQ